MLRRMRSTLAPVFLLLVIALPARAQFPGLPQEGTVSGAGTVLIDKPPTSLRLSIELLARGKDLPDALAKLKDRKEAARLQLAELGAIERSIQIAEPKLSTGKTPQQEQMQRMIVQRLRSRGKKGAPAQPTMVTIGAALTADWALEAGSTEDLLVRSHALEEKIKAADLAGLAELEELSPAEKELQEETANMGYGGGQEQAKPGEPVFLYVGPITDEERDQALAQAFGKAKTQAQQLSKAAGSSLGPLRSLTATFQPITDQQAMAGYGYQNPYYQIMQQYGEGSWGEGSQEAIGPRAGKVGLRVTVHAAFSLAAKQ